MSEDERNHEVDKLLDAGLARYSSAEPRPGLENRILAGLRAQPQPSRWLDWRWAGALATAAVAVLVLAVFFLRQPLPEPPPPAVARAPVPQPTPTAAPTPEPVQPPVITEVQPVPHPNAQASSHFHRSPEGRLGAGPRLDTFPAPAPLSEQQRLLLLLVQHTPKEQLLARQLGAGPIEPLEIQPLFFAPLEIQKPTTEN